MKISYNWLQQFLKIDWEAEKVGALLTDLGLEVEGIDTVESIKGSLKGIVIGEVITCVKHPDADRLKVTTVDIGAGELYKLFVVLQMWPLVKKYLWQLLVRYCMIKKGMTLKLKKVR